MYGDTVAESCTETKHKIIQLSIRIVLLSSHSSATITIIIIMNSV